MDDIATPGKLIGGTRLLRVDAKTFEKLYAAIARAQIRGDASPMQRRQLRSRSPFEQRLT